MTTTTNQIGLGASYGYISMNTGDWTGVPFSMTTSYQELRLLGTNFVLAAPAQDFSMPVDGRLRYIGGKTKLFFINAGITYASAGSFSIKLYKNGSPIPNSDTYNSAASRSLISGFPVYLSTNDYISLWIKRSSGSATSIYSIIVSAISGDGM